MEAGIIDPVHHPAHYQGAGLEVWQVIEDWGLGYHLGNAVKYILRCHRKGAMRQDLEKAVAYLKRVRVLTHRRWQAERSEPYALEVCRVVKAFDCPDENGDLSRALFAIRTAAWVNGGSAADQMIEVAISAIESRINLAEAQ